MESPLQSKWALTSLVYLRRKQEKKPVWHILHYALGIQHFVLRPSSLLQGHPLRWQSKKKKKSLFSFSLLLSSPSTNPLLLLISESRIKLPCFQTYFKSSLPCILLFVINWQHIAIIHTYSGFPSDPLPPNTSNPNPNPVSFLWNTFLKIVLLFHCLNFLL